MARCAPGKVTVHGYWRTKPRRKPKAPDTYWECRRGGHGQSCGMKHRTLSAALHHSARLNRAERKQGRKANWDAEKVTR